MSARSRAASIFCSEEVAEPGPAPHSTATSLQFVKEATLGSSVLIRKSVREIEATWWQL